MPPFAPTVARTYRALARERAALAAASDVILDTQIRIANIPAPTFSEARRGAWVADRLRASGWRARTDDVGNVIASAGPDGPAPVAVCAHLDTVYAPDAPPPAVVAGRRVVGSGICDNSRGLAALIALAEVLRQHVARFERPVHLVATTGEEGAGDLRGARTYVARERPGAFIALDGAGDTRIVNTALGSRRYRISFQGPGGHSWAAFGVANPVHAAARCASAIADLPLAADTTLTVSRIGGGVAVNAIAEHAWLEVDARGTSEGALEALDQRVRAAVDAVTGGENGRRTGGDPLRASIERIGHRGCGTTPESAELVAAAIEATRLIGRRPDLGIGSTDANAAMAEGIPAIAVGAGGRGGDVHTSHEWFDNTGASAGLERALTIVASVARLRD